MNKNRVIELLLDMRTPINEQRIVSLVETISNMSEEEVSSKLTQLNITEDNIYEYLSGLVNFEGTTEEFIDVNEWFCYGRTGNTVHMHLIPKELRSVKEELGDEGFYSLFKDQLEDFLAKMQGIVGEDESIKDLFAVSPIFYNSNIALIHEALGFNKVTEIDLNNHEDGMTPEQKMKFINMFNKGGKVKSVYYTRMSRERLLDGEYSEIDIKHNINR